MAPDDTLCIADNAEAFAEAVMRFLDRPDLALELGHKARTYVAENWTWEAHFLKLEKAFHESLDPVKKKGATSLEVTGVHA
jgi:glycosyltransferase involved in cell wall biosynthesis